MVCYKEEYVFIRRGLKPRDPQEITVNCPDKVGLAFDLVRIVHEFGLYVMKGDMSTDRRWCFVVLSVIPYDGSCPSLVRWKLLKRRLEDICPNALGPCWLPLAAPPLPEIERMLVLQVCSHDRTGLLYGVVQKLWWMELTVHKVKVSTTSDGIAMDLFFVTDNRTKQRWLETRVEEVKTKLEKHLGEAHVREILPIDPAYESSTCFPVPPSVTNEMFCDEPATSEPNASIVEKAGNPVVVKVENNNDPIHTLLIISCTSRRGLLYDCLRTLQDLNLKVAYARIPDVGVGLESGNSELCLFLMDAQGRKITDAQKLKLLIQSMEEAVGNPVRIKVMRRASGDTELLVATPLEKDGSGRPRVLLTLTRALDDLDINVLKADVGRHEDNDERWEIYRFVLADEGCDPPLSSCCTPKRIVDRLQQALAGAMQPYIPRRKPTLVTTGLHEEVSQGAHMSLTWKELIPLAWFQVAPMCRKNRLLVRSQQTFVENCKS